MGLGSPSARSFWVSWPRRSCCAPWSLKSSVDAKQLYDELYEQAAAEAEADTLGWLAAAGYGYQALREENSARVTWMSRISGALGVSDGGPDARLAGRAGGTLRL